MKPGCRHRKPIQIWTSMFSYTPPTNCIEVARSTVWTRGFTGDEGITDLPKLRSQRHRGEGAQHHMCLPSKLQGTLPDPDTQRPPSSALLILTIPKYPGSTMEVPLGNFPCTSWSSMVLSVSYSRALQKLMFLKLTPHPNGWILNISTGILRPMDSDLKVPECWVPPMCLLQNKCSAVNLRHPPNAKLRCLTSSQMEA